MDRCGVLPSVIGRLGEVASGGSPLPLREVGDAMGASYTLLFAERVSDGQVENPLVEGVDPAYGDRLKQAATGHMLPEWLHRLDPGTVMDRAALQRDTDFARSAFFDYVVRPEGRFHCLITTPYVTPTQRFHMIVGRPINREDFSAENMRVVGALLPHVGRLIANGAALSQASSGTGLLSSALDQLSVNVVLVARDCRIVFANSGARRVLGTRDGLHAVGGMLAACNPADATSLRKAVCQALLPAEAASATLSLRRPSGCPPLTVSVMPLGTETGSVVRMPAAPGVAMVLIGRPAEDDALDGSDLARRFGLTAKEAELASLLARGHGLRSAAAALGVTYHTVRYHLRHAFEKTGTHRQGELIRLVLAGPQRLSA